MYHPLLADPSELKDADLENKIIDLSKKYDIAARMGQGGPASQIIIALEMYKDEQRRRFHQANKTIAAKQQDNGLDDLINVE